MTYNKYISIFIIIFLKMYSILGELDWKWAITLRDFSHIVKKISKQIYSCCIKMYNIFKYLEFGYNCNTKHFLHKYSFLKAPGEIFFFKSL